MRISTRGRCGLRAMAYIAGKGDTVVSTRSIAESQGISESYLEQILAALRGGGLLRSVRGAGGGFVLTRPPEKITAGEILRTVEGSLSPAECLDEPELKTKNQGKVPGSCASCEDCAAKGVLSKVYGSVTEVVDSITVLDILDSKSI